MLIPITLMWKPVSPTISNERSRLERVNFIFTPTTLAKYSLVDIKIFRNYFSMMSMKPDEIHDAPPV
jgi:hypothetical protein